MSSFGFWAGLWGGFAVGLATRRLSCGRATGLATGAGLVLDGKPGDDPGLAVGATALTAANARAAGGPDAIGADAAILAATSGAPTAVAGAPPNERMPTAPAIPATKSAPTPTAARAPDPPRFTGAGVWVVGAPVSKLSASEFAADKPLVKVTPAGAALNEPLPSAEYGPLPVSSPRTGRPHTAASDSLNWAAV